MVTEVCGSSAASYNASGAPSALMFVHNKTERYHFLVFSYILYFLIMQAIYQVIKTVVAFFAQTSDQSLLLQFPRILYSKPCFNKSKKSHVQMDISQSESHTVHFGLKVSIISDDFLFFFTQIIPTYVKTQHVYWKKKVCFVWCWDKKTEIQWIMLLYKLLKSLGYLCLNTCKSIYFQLTWSYWLVSNPHVLVWNMDKNILSDNGIMYKWHDGQTSSKSINKFALPKSDVDSTQVEFAFPLFLIA